MMSRLRLLFLFLGAALLAGAQSVRWEPPGGTLSFNQTSELQLVFENCEAKGEPAVPAVPGLQLQSVGTARNMSIVNGRMSQSVVITFHARATQQGSVTIPSFSVATNKGRIEVPSASYGVGEATVGQGNISLDSVANSKIDAPRQVWAGEVFNIGYTLDVARRYFHSPGSNQPDWNPAPLMVEEWAKPEVQETVAAGEQRILINYHTRALARQPGEIELNPATQLVNLTTGSASFGIFSRPNLEQYSITSTRPPITVRALPSPAPATFNAAVGQFTLQSKVVPVSARVGEPITWTLSLSGTGNWPDVTALPARDVSRDFRVVQPQAHRTLKDGTLFEGSLSEDVVLIPTQPGSYTLGPVNWTYFDPTAGQYRTVTTEKFAVTVTAAAPAPSSSAAPSHPAQAGGLQAGNPDQKHPLAVAPDAPAAIPREALAPSGSAPLPWESRTLLQLCLLPWAAVLVLWLGLAWRRARQTDPLRPQREALARAKATVRQLRSTTDREKLDSLLQAWQREVAVVFGLGSAVPKPGDFTVATSSDDASAAVWATLWAEAEAALYRSKGELPADWADRAEAALENKRVPGFTPFQLFLRRNLLPFAASLALLFVFAGKLHAAAAASPEQLYSAGDFPAAEAAWRSEVKADPARWSARHNLALSLAQQSRWGEAAAQASAAFIQHPQDPTVRWEMAFILERAGYAPGMLTRFVAGAPAQSVARLLSPAEWQRCVLLLVATSALGAALVLLGAFGILGRWGRVLGLSLICLGILGGASAFAARSLYGEAGDLRAVLVWKPTVLRSIPTEADTTQKTSPLAPGSLAVVDQTFLTWSRLVFTNGQTGWVRQDDLVPIWK